EFNDDGDMKQVFSSPVIADGKVYIGEGYHQDKDCRLFCLDAATGKKLWEFQTTSHTESTPTVVGGRVYFGAGDDGVFCLDAATGKKLWQATGWHVDCRPEVVGKRLYGGSGYDNFEIFCLNVDDGAVVWRIPMDLPAFGSPTAAGDVVVFGLG